MAPTAREKPFCNNVLRSAAGIDVLWVVTYAVEVGAVAGAAWTGLARVRVRHAAVRIRNTLIPIFIRFNLFLGCPLDICTHPEFDSIHQPHRHFVRFAPPFFHAIAGRSLIDAAEANVRAMICQHPKCLGPVTSQPGIAKSGATIASFSIFGVRIGI